MIRILRDLSEEAEKLLKRSQLEYGDVNERVRIIVADVKARGDGALFEYTEKFDKVTLTADTVRVTEEEIRLAYGRVDAVLLASLRRAKQNIIDYQTRLLKPQTDAQGLKGGTGYVIRPVEVAGIYVPGGKAAYPSSVLMCALPAVVAGVKKIIMVTPFGNGVNPLTLVAANECGVSEIYKVGGAQAVAALAYGTQSIPKVDIIAGPGNIYVTLAKKEVYGVCGIDMLAGPSEILIIADKTARADYIAADMLSQAEHDELASSFLITDDAALADAVSAELDKQLAVLPRVGIAARAIADNGAIIVADSLERAAALSNILSPEHLEICTAEPEKLLESVNNAGAVFIGRYSPEPLGDYYAGCDHVLPTSGTAKFFSALSVDTFIKKLSVIGYTKAMLSKAKDDIIALASCEGLTAHAEAVKKRFQQRSDI
jgi:histidinol dehydrogenase